MIEKVHKNCVIRINPERITFVALDLTGGVQVWAETTVVSGSPIRICIRSTI